MSYTFLQEQGEESSAECFSGILQSAPSSWENTLAVSSDLVQKEETLNQVEEIARSCGMSPTWEMVDHYASRVAELEEAVRVFRHALVEIRNHTEDPASEITASIALSEQP